MGIQGYASLIKIKTDPASPAFERLNRIEELVKSGARLAGQLLGFARGGKYEVTALNLNEVIRGTLATFGRTRKEVVIMSSLSEEILPVDADRNQIEQVCMNLFVNASQAMPGGGQLHVETSNVTLEEAYSGTHGIKPGRYVRMSVTDSGVGMDEDTRSRVFDPFFTTRDKSRGAGLGLASVYGIVKNHGGSITVYSEVGHGTSFHIYLPVSQKSGTKMPEVIQDILHGRRLSSS
jgi:signal transduction histidine kinase